MRPEGARDPVRTLLLGLVREAVLPGASWSVKTPDGVASAGACGWAALVPEPEPASEGTPYDLASLTKPLATALLAVLLEAEGAIDLEAPLEYHLRELAGSPFAGATLLDLGSHRAGLPAWRPLYLHARGIDAVVGRIAGEPPAAPRGATLYSDLGYILLGSVLERATGISLDRLFESRIAEPLMLRSTGFATSGRRFVSAAPTEMGNAFERGQAGQEGASFAWRSELIRGEAHDGNAHALGGSAGHAGLFSTADEVASVAEAMLRPSALPLDARSCRRLFDPVVAGADRTFGFILAGATPTLRGVLPDEAVGHFGFTGTSVWVDRGRGQVFVLLSNRVHPRVPEGDFGSARRAFHEAALRALAA